MVVEVPAFAVDVELPADPPPELHPATDANRIATTTGTRILRMDALYDARARTAVPDRPAGGRMLENVPMPLDPRTPVLVGVGVAHQHEDDPTRAVEALDLMEAAARAAGADSGARGLLEHVDLILTPRGTWPYADPGAVLATRLAAPARAVLAPIGVLQQSLLTRAGRAVADGRIDVALVCGGEAKFRAQRAAVTGVGGRDLDDPTLAPSTELLPGDDELFPRVEIERGLAAPVAQYAVMEGALRHRAGQSRAAHARELAELWAGFSAVAAGNPDAWRRDPVTPAMLIEPGASNPMLASPYTKWHCSQWNVDQAAALLLCSVAVAVRLGVPEDRWVFPRVAVESNAIVPLSARADLDRSPAVARAGERLVSLGERSADEMDHLDLYSCFPSAVRIQANEFGIASDRPLTVTGGMGFAGGPLNSYVLQATARMAAVLRAEPGRVGLVTSVSGMLTKFGLGSWSTTPPRAGFRADEIGADVLRATPTRPLDPDAAGDVTIAGFTVIHDHGAPVLASVIGETPDGTRSLAAAFDGELAADLAAGEWIGRTATVDGPTLRAIS